MRYQIAVLVCGLSLSFLGCQGGGSSSSGVSSTVSTSSISIQYDSNTGYYSYDLQENGCDTGRQYFYSMGGLCRGLESDYVNSYCALDLREQLFQNSCYPRYIQHPFRELQ